jgi:predicted negative regulator of RcsB-dependent stress response
MYDLEEQEQIDALKAWWRDNRRVVIAAVVAAAVAAAGTSGWRWWRSEQAEKASMLYATFEKAMAARDVKQMREVAGELKQRYGSTAFAPMAALASAKAGVEAGDLESAASELRWVAEHAREDETAAIGRLRLAAVLLDEKKYKEALEQLEHKHPDQFAGLYADLRGDILVEEGKREEARSAYAQALEKLPPEGNYRQLVQAKLDALGGAK